MAWVEARRISIRMQVTTAISMNARKCQQKSAVHGEHRGGQHHEEGDDRKEIVIAVPLGGEQANHHDEEHEMYCGSYEYTREHKVICEIESHVPEGKRSGPSSRE